MLRTHTATPSLHAVALRYIRSFLLRDAAWSLDMLARLSVLEGAAGVAPGKWLAQRERGFASALDHFGPNLASGWSSATDRGLYDQAVSVASKMLRNVSWTDGEELVQDMVSHSSSATGPKRQRVFYSIGESLRSHDRDLGDGKIAPDSTLVRGRLVHWVENAARDVISAWHTKNVQPSGGDVERERATPPLTDSERDNLLLLALQSPGGAGADIRRIIDHLIDHHFSQSERAVVRLFLEKISHPKYRSPSAMKEMVRTFHVDKWFTQAFNLVRREIMDSTGISPQRLTNILGSDAAKVFAFLTNVVAEDSRIKSTLSDLSEEIEMVEPGFGHRVGSGKELLVALVGELLAALPGDLRAETMPIDDRSSALGDFFEKDQYGEWGQQSLPLSEFSRGPTPLYAAQKTAAREERRRVPMLRQLAQTALLHPQWRRDLVPLVQLGALSRDRVAHRTIPLRRAVIETAFATNDATLRRELIRIVSAHDAKPPEADTLRGRIASLLRRAKYSPTFLKWVENQKFKNPDTNNDVSFHSLPAAEQGKVYDQWATHRKEWAQQHKPEGLSKKTLLTPEKFDEVEKGNLLWVSWSPKMLYKVVDRSKSPGGKAMLDCVLVDPKDPSKDGERRTLHRSSVENDKYEIHLMPEAEDPEAPEASPDESESKGEASPVDKPKGKHADRKELSGRSRKSLSDQTHVNDSLRKLLLPEGLDELHRQHAEESLKEPTYQLLSIVHDNTAKAIKDPQGKYMKALNKRGYSAEVVQALNKALESKLAETKGRKYSKAVLDVANQHDLEGEDADELYEFKHGRPRHGRPLQPQELMQRFLQKASPETRERMKGMPVADFMAMYNAIMADEDEAAVA